MLKHALCERRPCRVRFFTSTHCPTCPASPLHVSSPTSFYRRHQRRQLWNRVISGFLALLAFLFIGAGLAGMIRI